MKRLSFLLPLFAALLVAACSTTPLPPREESAPAKPADEPMRHIPTPPEAPGSRSYFSLEQPQLREQIVISAFGLLDTGYRFGGRNPEAGLDCSGMVSYLVEAVSGQQLPHNADQIASITRPIARDELEAGDLVFFNTTGRRYSHMGIYLGNDKFIHAPSSRGRVRVERMNNRYFAPRFSGARTLIASE